MNIYISTRKTYKTWAKMESIYVFFYLVLVVVQSSLIFFIHGFTYGNGQNQLNVMKVYECTAN